MVLDFPQTIAGGVKRLALYERRRVHGASLVYDIPLHPSGLREDDILSLECLWTRVSSAPSHSPSLVVRRAARVFKAADRVL